MAAAGTITLYLTFFAILLSIILGLVGLKRRREGLIDNSHRADLISVVSVFTAVSLLLRALVSSDFSLKYVAEHTSSNLPVIFKISAMWAGQSGSILLWLFILSIIVLILELDSRYRQQRLDLKLITIINVFRLFFVFLLLMVNSPFTVAEGLLNDGSGLNPMLQSIGMIIHPPILFLGFSGFAIPFALVISALTSNKEEIDWARYSRPWILFSWVMLTAGIVTGGNWAYTELGWGGYWAWDPVENASLFPWLTATALIHSLIMQRKKKGMIIWNYLLISFTFILTIFGTFITRSGIFDSVHSFSDSEIGYYFMVMIVILIIFVLYLFYKNYDNLKFNGERPGFFTRETGMILTNIILLILFAGVFLGTIFPIISEFTGRRIVLDKSFFNQLTVPFWLALIFLMGVCPLLEWKKTDTGAFLKNLFLPLGLTVTTLIIFYIRGYGRGYGQLLAGVAFGISTFALVVIFRDFLKGFRHYYQKGHTGLLSSVYRFFSNNRRRYGAYIVHLGIILMLIGISGSSTFVVEKMASVDPGEEIKLGNYRMEYKGLKMENWLEPRVTATVEVYEGDRFRGKATPEKVFVQGYKQPATNVSILSSLKNDIYFNLAGWQDQKAQLQVSIHPLVAWIWIGSYIIYLGIIVVLWPRRRRG